jgi:DNA adenine methylase
VAHGPSFLRWAGSKRKSLGMLASGYRDFTRQYVEPFAGSAALFFQLTPATSILGDLNGQLINTLQQVRDQPGKLYKELMRIERNSENYYRIREEFNSGKQTGFQSAIRFIYLNRNCFNGLWRTNMSGGFNVPFGGFEMGAYPPLDLFMRCAESLQKAKLQQQDFRKTISEADDRAFVYADPPYFSTSERIFIEYGKQSFNEDDLHDLISSLKSAEVRGAHIALTYNAAMEIEGLPDHWRRTQFDVTRNVGGFSGARKRQSEILYSNFDVSTHR